MEDTCRQHATSATTLQEAPACRRPRSTSAPDRCASWTPGATAPSWSSSTARSSTAASGAAVVDALRDRFRCVVPDLPLGSHGSRCATRRRPLAARASPGSVAALLDALDLDDVTLVGNDTGGALCQLVAARRPSALGPPRADRPATRSTTSRRRCSSRWSGPRKSPARCARWRRRCGSRPCGARPSAYGRLTKRPDPRRR